MGYLMMKWVSPHKPQESNAWHTVGAKKAVVILDFCTRRWQQSAPLKGPLRDFIQAGDTLPSESGRSIFGQL